MTTSGNDFRVQDTAALAAGASVTPAASRSALLLGGLELLIRP